MNKGLEFAEDDMHRRAGEASIRRARKIIAEKDANLKRLTTENEYHQVIIDWVSSEKDYWHEQATHDPLTNLLNKRGLDEQLSKKIEQATEEDNIGLFYIDLTNFKRVNDEQGHQMGDAVLVSVANILKYTFRKDDALSYVGRTGGDEFIALCDLQPRPDRDNTLSAKERMQHIKGRLTTEFNHFRQGIIEGGPSLESMKFDVSIGQAIWTPGTDTEGLIALAEHDMYEHKNQQHEAHGSYR